MGTERSAAMPRVAIFGRNAKVTKISGACGMRSCYGSVGPLVGHAPVYWRRICISVRFFACPKKRTKKKSPAVFIF